MHGRLRVAAAGKQEKPTDVRSHRQAQQPMRTEHHDYNGDYHEPPKQEDA